MGCRTCERLIFWLVLCLAVGAFAIAVSGCSSEGVGKGPATQSVVLSAAVAAGAATVLTLGWAAILGFLAGAARIFVADSIPEGGGGGTTVVHQGIPWWVLALVILWLVRAHLWDWITGNGASRWDSLLRMLKLRTHKTPRPEPAPTPAEPTS